MTAETNSRAGKPATADLLVDVPRLITAYFSLQPDAGIPAQQVAFGTSGHRGTALQASFNEWHVLAISQAICEYRSRHGHRRAAVPRSGHPRAFARRLARALWKCWRRTASRS